MNISPAEKTTERRRFGIWGRLPLARKLLLAFGALFVFTIVIAIVALNGLNDTQNAYEEALAQGVEIRRISEQLETSLLQARANEKDFLLRWRKEGYFTARKNYVEPYTQNLADMREQIAQLSAFEDEVTSASTDLNLVVQYKSDIASLGLNVDDYERSFSALVAAYQKKGFDDESTDLESRFRLAARRLEEKFFGRTSTDVELENLQSLFARIRLNEKDYLLSTELNYISAMQMLAPELRGKIRISNELSLEEKTELLAQLDEYLAAVDELQKLDKEIAGYEKELGIASKSVEKLTTDLKSLGEQLSNMAVDQARSNSIRTFTTSMFAIVVVLVLSTTLAITFAQQITRPTVLLTRIAKEIAEGNFNMYAEVTSADEIGTLTQTINDMSVQLRSALRNLEQRASELRLQTSQLELANRQSQKRAEELQIIAEISRYTSTEKDLEKLLPLITQTVSEKLGFYHVGIFLLDDSARHAVLLAANSPGGQAMLRRHHKLEVGQVGIVGNVTSTGVPRIAADTGRDAVFFDNPDLPETHSEMALPLRVEEEVIGALDIQSTEINAFSDEDVEALTILADQLSIAIQNARLLSQFEKSLAEADALQRQYLRETWGNLSKQENVSGYRYSIAGAVPLDKETKAALETDKRGRNAVSLPILLRGEEIGELSVQMEEDRRVNSGQMDLIRAVVERVALSAENARLFEETSSRASRERLVTDITTKIRSATDPQEMINTAVEELQRALNVKRIEIVPGKLRRQENE
jgi:GAF domain-containing protein/HAMP domain-containing protein